ncbi:hypothetical protein BV25DRAFT_708415 [Artomyces pyxidatus]|uniref:Uncharacterized protein n=1 Tax=Artomyces pyxidatus TaxID=48021 RepID=A0ACB8SYZ4_9AGAM|nr:hypothetical protein BV25DRAFT_708415 [Artomyces pyxidatus]
MDSARGQNESDCYRLIIAERCHCSRSNRYGAVDLSALCPRGVGVRAARPKDGPSGTLPRTLCSQTSSHQQTTESPQPSRPQLLRPLPHPRPLPLPYPRLRPRPAQPPPPHAPPHSAHPTGTRKCSAASTCSSCPPSDSTSRRARRGTPQNRPSPPSNTRDTYRRDRPRRRRPGLDHSWTARGRWAGVERPDRYSRARSKGVPRRAPLQF